MYMLCNTVWCDMSCVMMDGAWSTAAKREYSGRYQARQVRHSEWQYGELRRPWGVEACSL